MENIGGIGAAIFGGAVYFGMALFLLIAYLLAKRRD